METTNNHTEYHTNRYGRLRIPNVDECKYVKCSFYNGRATGIYTEYYDNNSIKCVGDLDDELEEGLWRYYNEDGSQKAQGLWTEGKEHGEWLWYHPTNQHGRSTRQRVRMRGSFEHGKRHGVWKMYTPANALASEYQYVNGVYHGTCFVYYADGTIRVLTYEMGTLTTEQLFAAERNTPRRNRMVVQQQQHVPAEHKDLIDVLRCGGLLPAIQYILSEPQDCPLSLCPIDTTFVKCTNHHAHYFSSEEYAKYAHAAPENAHRCPIDKTFLMDSQQYHV